jgi:BASS family bile acid:Na+ symporter
MEIGQVYYDANSQWLLNVVMATMILGIALDIKWQDFKAITKRPKAVIAGLSAQLVALPALTTVLTLILELDPGIELGMILVSSCPGGVVSNFVTHLAKGNTALSISMTAASSAMATVMLPFNFIFWSQVNPATESLMRAIDVSGTDLFINLLGVIALPLVAGLFIKHKWPTIAKPLHKGLKSVSTLMLFVFIFVAVYRNQQAFLAHFWLIFSVVLMHNAIALLLGFMTGKLANLPDRDVKATTIEVGMQNSTFALAIVFGQFNAEAGMALIAAFWGTWHIVSGLIIALLFSRWDRMPLAPCTAKNL